MAYITKQRIMVVIKSDFRVVSNKTLFQTINTWHEKNLQTEYRGQHE